MATTIAAVFSSRLEADRAVEDLVRAGIGRGAISLLVAESSRGQHFKVVEGDKAAQGAIGGGVVGGTVGLLAGIGLLAIPGLGPFIAAGPIVAALAGAGAGGAVGTLTGALVGMGIPEYEAKRYESIVHENGKALLAVHADNREWADKAKHIMKAAGGTDIDTKSEVTSKKAG